MEPALPTEIEIKLDLSNEALESLFGSDLLGEPDDALQQSSTYFETDDRRLSQKGFSLRIRSTGSSHVQTVKASGPAKSLFVRSEWETPIEGKEPVLDHTSPLMREFGPELEVEAAFTLFIERRIWNIELNGSRLEVVVDRGDVVSGNRRSPVQEIEVELKDGDQKDLFVFIRKIDAIAPFRFGIQSKSERGLALLDRLQFMFKAERLDLERNIKASAAFREIATSCFRQFRLNEEILLQRRNSEALHQARVALRRLRSAFSLFRPLLMGDEPKRIQEELRWLAGVLGEARNLDVLLMKAKDSDLRAKLKGARNKAYGDAVEALESARGRALMLDFNEWLQCDTDRAGGGGATSEDPPASEFAAKALEKMRKKLKRHGSALAETDDEHRHQVRKDAKKLRYAAEFFGSLFDDKRGGRRYRKLIVAMEALQDHLGALNDLATGPDVLEQHGLADHPARDSVVSHEDKNTLIRMAQSSVDEVIDTKRFWR
ncbi:CHAD domain-containing protein (plasmid) [Rhizobium indicum]|nr:CHAD domain-containing protein [Rhizobium indicum]